MEPPRSHEHRPSESDLAERLQRDLLNAAQFWVRTVGSEPPNLADLPPAELESFVKRWDSGGYGASIMLSSAPPSDRALHDRVEQTTQLLREADASVREAEAGKSKLGRALKRRQLGTDKLLAEAQQGLAEVYAGSSERAAAVLVES